MDFTTSSEIILCEPEEEGLPCILIKAYGIGVISISLNPETKGSKRIEERFDGKVEEDGSDGIPLGNPSIDGEAGAQDAIYGYVGMSVVVCSMKELMKGKREID